MNKKILIHYSYYSLCKAQIATSASLQLFTLHFSLSLRVKRSNTFHSSLFLQRRQISCILSQCSCFNYTTHNFS